VEPVPEEQAAKGDEAPEAENGAAIDDAAEKRAALRRLAGAAAAARRGFAGGGFLLHRAARADALVGGGGAKFRGRFLRRLFGGRLLRGGLAALAGRGGEGGLDSGPAPLLALVVVPAAHVLAILIVGVIVGPVILVGADGEAHRTQA